MPRILEQQAELAGPLAASQEKGFTLEYLGTEDVDGTPAHKIKVQRKSGDVQYVFLDPDYYLIIRIETHNLVRGAETVTETDLGDYENVAGVWIPFSIETGPKGMPKDQKRIVEKAEANFGLDEATFAFPKKGVAIKPPTGAAVTVLPGSSTPPAPPAESAVRFDSGVVSGLGARNIGSAAMSGRVAAVAAYNEGGKTTIFVGSASGGVWKSIDGGTTFKPTFDKATVQSIGALAVDPSNHKIVWAGTGEPWTRNSVSIGDGIYKSTDGGESWKNVGLPNSERIVKIVVHPRNSAIVYACVPGKLWSDSTDRGLYKTVDGGKSWTLVLKGPNASTGCSGISLDPKNPDVLLAGLWDFRRKGWTFRSGGDGPEAFSGSGLFRSADGGKTWTELTEKSAKGLPEKPWGRVEVVYAPSNDNIVYAFIEGKDSALFYSGDGGKTWEARDQSRNMVWRPFYFARLIIDPKNPARIFKPNLTLVVSEDGGKSFASAAGNNSHGDWHDLWIDPDNTQHIIGGDDGGLWISHDGGSRWWKTDNLPISQFYHVSVDDHDPYRVYGGLQDNSSWVGDSEYPGGITNDRWDPVFWGDGFVTLADPTDPNAVYAESQGGYVARIDRTTRALRDIQPKADYHEKLRFNWNTPIALSPNAKGIVYIGAQFLFRSRDRGDTWERISPDLTTNDPEKQKQEESGGITVDNSSAEMHTTIYSISESPKNGRVIWVGTDDGNLQVTRDGAKTWTNVVKNVPDLPPASWVSSVEASRFDAATAYATFDRHTFGDLTPFVFKTTDYGKSWTRIAGPDQLRGYANVIKEDSVKPSILFVGTELGLFITADGGKRWAEFKGNDFPSVSVRDLAVQPRAGDLVIGTHGRGIWIIDDLSPLRALSDALLAESVAFLPTRPAQQRMFGIGGWANGDAKFTGQNPQNGAPIAYYQRTRHLFGPLTLEILGADGKPLDTVQASKRRGINRVVWTTRVAPPRVPRAAQLAFNGTQGPRVLPGTYEVRLTSGKEVLKSKLNIAIDRRAPYKLADKKAQFDAAMRVHGLFGTMSGLVDRIETARNVALDDASKLKPTDELKKSLESFSEKLEELKKLIVATKEGGAITGEERLREHADILYGALMIWEGRPAKYQLKRIDVLTRELGDVQKDVGKLLAAEVPALDSRAGQAQAGADPHRRTRPHRAHAPELGPAARVRRLRRPSDGGPRARRARLSLRARRAPRRCSRSGRRERTPSTPSPPGLPTPGCR